MRIGVIMYQTSLTKGQELVAQRMVKEFRRLGHDAFLITSIYQDSKPVISAEEVKRRGGYVHVYDRDLGIPVIRVSSDDTTWPPRRISFVDFVGVLTSIVDDLKLNVIITHSTLWNGPEEVVKFVAWRKRMAAGGAPRTPLIFCHMSHFQDASDERYAIAERSYREAWNNVILPQILAEADLILVTTPYEAASMKKLGARDDSLFLFPGGINDEDIATMGDVEQFRAKFKLPKSANLVSCLGTVEERKNELELLDVAKILVNRHDVRFVIAGKCEGVYADHVRMVASTIPNVSVLGEVTDEDKAALIRTSMANITLSRSESLGISQLEFMSAGVPVITSGVGGQAWIVRDGSNGIIVDGPDDAAGAARAVERLADHPRVRARMGRAASRAASVYSMTRLVYNLSKRLEAEIKKRNDDMPALKGMPEDERIIEAWVHKGQNVAATSKRLIVRSVVGGNNEVTSVPYDEISNIVPYSEVHWAVLGIGAAATMALVAQRIAGLGLLSRLAPPVSNALASFGLAGLTGTLMTVLPFIPVALGALIFGLAINRGFVVQYGTSRRLFLPGKFIKALRLADKLTPNDLFAGEDSGATVAQAASAS
ncbi:MAG TPA: glycosyltransferase family 4 protein [Nitrososphaerales archaeon]|nr:glycosyltransferase family 4 protein [Nitrososphaerales archaeon]